MKKQININFWHNIGTLYEECEEKLHDLLVMEYDYNRPHYFFDEQDERELNQELQLTVDSPKTKFDIEDENCEAFLATYDIFDRLGYELVGKATYHNMYAFIDVLANLYDYEERTIFEMRYSDED